MRSSRRARQGRRLPPGCPVEPRGPLAEFPGRGYPETREGVSRPWRTPEGRMMSVISTRCGYLRFQETSVKRSALASALLLGTLAFASAQGVPPGYPADYQAIISAAEQEGSVA